MSKIERFEDIQAWQKARQLNKEIYKVSNQGAFQKDFGLRDQIRRASISILSNIAEGFDRRGNKELIYFLSISKASSAELRAQLYAAVDLEYITNVEFQFLYDLAVETSKMISGFIKYLENNGRRF